jgi:tetratricopeptide (TPR) repeat protein
MMRSPTPEEHSLLTQATSLHQAGSVAEARSLYRQVLVLRPDDPDLLRVAGAAEIQLGDHAAALDLLDRSLTLAPAQAGGLYNRGLALQALGRIDEAIASYDETLKLRPDYADALMNRSNCLLELRRYEEALAGFDRVLAIHPHTAATYSNRAIALVNLDKLEAAAASFRTALALTPGLVEAHAGLADVYERQGDHKRAVVQWSHLAEQAEQGDDLTSRLYAMDNMARLLAEVLKDPDAAATVAQHSLELRRRMANARR